MKKLTKTRKLQLKVLIVILLLLIVSANELWTNDNNKEFYKKLDSYVQNENDLNENKEYFLLAANDNKFNIMKMMMEARFQDPVLFDFVYIGNGINKVSKNGGDINEIDLMKKNYINSWNKWRVNVVKKDNNVFDIESINCKFSIYCYYKKEQVKRETFSSGRAFKKDTIERIIKEFDKKED